MDRAPTDSMGKWPSHLVPWAWRIVESLLMSTILALVIALFTVTALALALGFDLPLATARLAPLGLTAALVAGLAVFGGVTLGASWPLDCGVSDCACVVTCERH